ACPVQHQAGLLLRRLGLHKTHVRPRYRFTDGLAVGGIILLPLHVGLHIGRRHEPHAMPKRPDLARPMMRRSLACFAPHNRDRSSGDHLNGTYAPVGEPSTASEAVMASLPRRWILGCRRGSLRWGGDGMERRLAAILAADVVGYSRLMEQDEAGTMV